MGEAADRVKKDGSPEHAVRRVSGEIDALRNDLGNLVAELDRRRHEMFDLGLQARRHPVAIAVAAATAALVAGGLIAVAIRARRRRRSPAARAREARRALARLLDHPQRVAAVVLALGTGVGLWGWTRRVRKPLDVTRRSLEEDVRWAKQRIA